MAEQMAEALDGLLDEVRLLFHRAAQAVEELHGAEPVTAGTRAVLEALQRGGPATVPGLARRRHVSRQHIQVLVNDLVAKGLVAAEGNPAHRRSPLYSLTADGARTIRRITERERRFLARLDVALDSGQVADAARALAVVREALGGFDGRLP
jgi:DNA-binding MarR family transcriptional regulator